MKNCTYKLPPEVDGYIIGKQIGAGGNSFVFDCKKDGKSYAMKIINKQLRGNNKIRFENEVKFQMENNHNCIVRIIWRGRIQTNYGDLDKKKTTDYYVMPKYNCSFATIMANDINVEHKLKLYLNICGALNFIHKRKPAIIHRDIKPENFLYDEKSDKLLLSDFGIAYFYNKNKVTTKKEKLANFAYAAPEQRNQQECGVYTDIYSMGLILNQIFTNSIPEGNDYTKIQTVAPLYTQLDDLVRSMCMSNPKEREKSIKNVETIIKNILDEINGEMKRIQDYFYDPDYDNKANLLLYQIQSDVVLGNLFLNQKEMPNNINFGYHNNLLFNMHEYIINSLFVLEAYDKLRKYVDYEAYNMAVNEEWLKYDKSENEQAYLDLWQFFDSLKESVIKSVEHIMAKTLRLLYVIKGYHSIEAVNYIKKAYNKFVTSRKSYPILAVVAELMKLKNEGILTNLDILSCVKVDYEKSDSKIANNNIYEENKQQLIKDALASQFGITVFNDLDSSPDIVFAFDSDQHLLEVLNLVEDAKNGKLKDDIDIDDVYSDLHYHDSLKCQMENYNFNVVLCKNVLDIN